MNITGKICQKEFTRLKRQFGASANSIQEPPTKKIKISNTNGLCSSSRVTSEFNTSFSTPSLKVENVSNNFGFSPSPVFNNFKNNYLENSNNNITIIRSVYDGIISGLN